MARCPFATWDPISGWSGSNYTGNAVWKILHHKTQGNGYPRSTYEKTGGIPHFTVGANQIWQHFDTSIASRALFNAPGGVETNRQFVIQIEAIGWAGREDLAVARNVRRLTDWLEAVHGIPHVWPGGRPRTAKYDANGNPQSPGITPVSNTVWLTKSGHYAHSQAPENQNAHWDPAYTDGEWNVIYGQSTEEDEMKFSLITPKPPHAQAGQIWLTNGLHRTYCPSTDAVNIMAFLNGIEPKPVEIDGWWFDMIEPVGAPYNNVPTVQGYLKHLQFTVENLHHLENTYRTDIRDVTIAAINEGDRKIAEFIGSEMGKMLTYVRDRTAEVINAINAAAGGEGPIVDPNPSPTEVIDKMIEVLEQMKGQFTPPSDDDA